MRIAELHPYPPEIGAQIPVLPGGITQGGSETSSFRYSLKLAEQGYKVTYFVAKYPGITVDRLDIGKNFQMVYLKTFFKNVGTAFSFKLFFKLLFGDYDVIQSHQIPTMFSFTGAIAAFIRRKPFILTFHGRQPYSWPDRAIGYIAAAMSVAVTVQNEYAFELVKEFVPEKKIVIIPHGIDMDLFKYLEPTRKFLNMYKPNNEKVILFVGRLIPPKGIDVLIDAFDIVRRNNPKTRLYIVGTGKEASSLQKKVKAMSLEKKVFFLGNVNQDELPKYYAITDVFVLPSTYHDSDGKPIDGVSENFGLVLAEAMSCRVPIVASAVGGIPQWIADGKTGLLFEERNVEQLATLLERVLNWDSKTRKKITDSAYSEIQKTYSWEAVIKQFEDYFLPKA